MTDTADRSSPGPPPAFDAYGPADRPVRVAPGVWLVDGPEIAFGYLGVNLPFPTRMTLVALKGGGLWVHSPTQPTEALFEAVRGLGDVRWLIASNTLHYWWIPEWKARFPAAEVFVAPGLKRSAKRPLPVGVELEDQAPSAWRGEIDQIVVSSALLTEVVFFHRASRSLILTDLIENFELDRTPRRWLRALIRLGGAADPDGKAPYDMQLSFLGQRRRLRKAVRQMIAWSPERVILAHGRWYRRNAVDELRRAFRWAGPIDPIP